MNDNTFKTIIIVCLVAIVAILGVSAYFFVNTSKETMANTNLSANQAVQNASSVSNTTSKNITSTKNTAKSTEKHKTNLISAQRAIDIVEQSSPGSEKCTFSAKLHNNGGAPYYLVTAYDAIPGSSTYGEGIGGAKVDARTGVILDEMG